MKEWGDLSDTEKMNEMLRKNVGNKEALNVIKRAGGKMARIRKTIQIKNIKKRVNDFLHDSKDFMKPERQVMATFLESVLMDTQNYRGFGYLNKNHMEDSAEGTTVGINSDKDRRLLKQEKRFKSTDSSRVQYF